MIRMKKDNLLKNIPTEKLGIIGMVLWVMILFMGGATYMAYDAVQEWEQAIERGESFSLAPDAKHGSLDDYLEKKEILQIIQQEGAAHNVTILGAEDDNKAKQGYRVDCCGTYHDMIYMINALEKRAPLYYIDIVNMEATKEGNIEMKLDVRTN